MCTIIFNELLKREKISKSLKERTLQEMGHKIDCRCNWCRAKKGEGKNMKLHKSNCQCSFCKAMRSKGKSISERHKLDCQCCFCKAKRGELEKSAFKGKRHTEKAKKQMGFDKGKSLKEMNHKINCQCSFCKAMRGEYTRENNPAWNNGSSFGLYSLKFNDKLKELIRKRDNYQCQLCGISENGRKLDIHHINYDKKIVRKRNLITLCQSHNAKVNGDRNKWQFLFEVLQEIRRI